MPHNRLYISADIEGIAGVVSGEHTMPAGFEYNQAREWMTNEVLAACSAAFDNGIKDIVISDSHGNGQNLLLDRLPTGTQLVRSWPRPLCMMEGVDQGKFDAALLIGYHASATHQQGVLAHTLHGKGIVEVKINGRSASETFISAATAGHFGVPVILASGDDAYAQHTQELFDDIEAVTVKWAHSTTSARTLLPQDACEIIYQQTDRALKRLQDFKPFVVGDSPILVDVNCVSRRAAELLCFMAMFRRISATQVAFEADTMVDVSKVLSFLVASGTLMV